MYNRTDKFQNEICSYICQCRFFFLSISFTFTKDIYAQILTEILALAERSCINTLCETCKENSLSSSLNNLKSRNILQDSVSKVTERHIQYVC
jgi:hypothetical protein